MLRVHLLGRLYFEEGGSVRRERGAKGEGRTVVGEVGVREGFFYCNTFRGIERELK